MTDRIPVFVYARDPVLESGIASQLRSCPEVWVVDATAVDSARVAVIVADEIDEETLRVAKTVQRTSCPRVVLVVPHPDDAGLLAAVEAGVCGILRRSEATPSRLAAAVTGAAAGEGSLPPDLLGQLLRQVGNLQRDVLLPRGLTFNGLTDREIEVLKLVADGMSTSEIADKLSYSERTIKNVIQGITTRLHLRNRSHAIAYAMRAGLI